MIGDAVSYPSYVTVGATGNGLYTWNGSTSDPPALQKSAAADRIAACWYSVTSDTFTIDFNFTDPNTHQVAVYVLDMNGGRAETIQVLDTSNNVLNTQAVSAFDSGRYLVWNLRGHVVLKFTRTGLYNAVGSGLFFGGAGSPSYTQTIGTSPSGLQFLVDGATYSQTQTFHWQPGETHVFR